MSNNSTVKCPSCAHEFPIGNAMAQEIENDIRSKYLKRYNEDKQKFESEKSLLDKRAEQISKLEEKQKELIEEKVQAQRVQLEQEAKKKALDEQQLVMNALTQEVEEKTKKLRESQAKELEFLQKEKGLHEKEMNLKLELEKLVIERQKEIEEKVKKIESERSELKIRELEKKLADQMELAETMRRKAEQGSMQLQGEVQELALEELLRNAFPYDTIEEVAKGVKGADCILHVKNHLLQDCGKIIYESKRTKAFTAEWIEKLKLDMRSQQADIAIIVTETLPKDMTTFGFKEGVWICRFSEVKALSFALRESLIRIRTALVSQENKGEKVQMLYDYLTGNEFRQNIDAVVEGFMSLRDGISRERIQMEKIWKEREKQIEKVLINTSQFYGSIKGIAGSAIADIKLLE